MYKTYQILYPCPAGIPRPLSLSRLFFFLGVGDVILVTALSLYLIAFEIKENLLRLK
jgi:hypothetical protein